MDKTLVLKTNGSLMKVESIAECSNTFGLHKGIIGLENQFGVFFLGGHLRQILLYMKASDVPVFKRLLNYNLWLRTIARNLGGMIVCSSTFSDHISVLYSCSLTSCRSICTTPKCVHSYSELKYEDFCKLADFPIRQSLLIWHMYMSASKMLFNPLLHRLFLDDIIFFF